MKSTIAGSLDRVTRTASSHRRRELFEDSPLPLGKWLTAMWQIVNRKNGISSHEVHRAIGITQKSAWFMDRRIRFAPGMEEAVELSGHVEADETFIGGKARNMHKGKKAERITTQAVKTLCRVPDYAASAPIVITLVPYRR